VVQLLDGYHTTGDNRRGLLPLMAQEAGFSCALKLIVPTPIGTLRMWALQKQADEDM
jgi:hypothetical protein